MCFNKYKGIDITEISENEKKNNKKNKKRYVIWKINGKK